MTAELERWDAAPLSWGLRREIAKVEGQAELQSHVDGGANRREMERLIHQGNMTRLRLDINFAMGDYIMDRLEDLDAHRRQTAGLDPEMNMMMMQIQMNTIAAASRIQRNFGA